MIKVSGNQYSHCEACGTRPDTLLIHLDHEDDAITLCDECGIKIVKAIASYMSL